MASDEEVCFYSVGNSSDGVDAIVSIAEANWSRERDEGELIFVHDPSVDDGCIHT